MKQMTIRAVTVLALAGSVVQAQENQVPAPQPSTDAAAAAATAVVPPKPKWDASMGLGASVTDGNTETTLFTANAIALRKWDKNEFEAKVDGGYGTDSGDQNVGYIKGSAQYNRLLTERLYLFGRAEGLHDDIADVAYRAGLSAGVGYYLIKNDKITLSGEVGPGYIWEKLGDDERDYATVRFGEKFTWKISDRARFWQSFDYQPKIDEWAQYFVTFEAGVEADITKTIALRVVFQDWYNSDPAFDSSTNEWREYNDLKLIAGLNYKFM